MAFPYHPKHENICPNCGKTRVMESGVGFYSCPNSKCQLKLQFQQSPNNKPDPLTEIALRDTLATSKIGIRSYLEEIQNQATSAEACSDIDISLILQVLQSWLLAAIPAARPNSHRHKKRRSEIEDFNWVTLYRVNSPDILNCEQQRSERELKKVVKHMDLQCRCYENRKLSLSESVVKFLGPKWYGGRHNIALLEFSKSIIHIINTRKPLVVPSEELSCMLHQFERCQQKVKNPYHPLHLRIRCLLWTLSDLMSREAWVLFGCSSILLEQRIKWIPGDLINVILLPIMRFGDVIDDYNDLQRKFTPAYLPSLLRYVLTHDGQLILCDEIYGDLDTFLKPGNIRDKNISLTHMPACKKLIKNIISDSDSETVRFKVSYFQESQRLSLALSQGFS
ncbi:hypothetical protein V2G26_013500 [Clonostachys chloroleuca]